MVAEEAGTELPLTAATSRNWFLKDGFDVVAVRVEHEGGVVAPAVLGTEAGRAVVRAAVANRRGVPALDADVIGRDKRDVRGGRDAVSTWLDSDSVKREVVARAAPEQDIGIAFELAFAQGREAELPERRLVHAPADGEVAHPDADMIDHLADHGPPDSSLRVELAAAWSFA